MKVVVTILILLQFLQNVNALESWQENYGGAYYVLPTLLIFAIIFGVLVILSIVFAVVLTVKERMNKTETNERSQLNKETENMENMDDIEHQQNQFANDQNEMISSSNE